jgi:hypothetical protein
METILAIPRKIRIVRKFGQFGKEEVGWRIEISQCYQGWEGSHALRQINMHRNHHNKMLHPLVEINNHLVEGLVDIGASMFVMSAEIILG